jgi:hypothetical protein
VITMREVERLRERALTAAPLAIPPAVMPWAGYGVARLLPGSDAPPLLAVVALLAMSATPLGIWLARAVAYWRARREYAALQTKLANPPGEAS